MKKKKISLTFISCAALLAIGFTSYGINASKSEFLDYSITNHIDLTQPNVDMTPPLNTVEKTTYKAELIVYGEIEDLEYRPEKILPQTIGTIRIEKCLKGDVEEGSTIQVRKQCGYTTNRAQKKAWLGSVLSEEELKEGSEEPEDLQLAILQGDWPLEKNSKHVFCLYPQNVEDGETIYNIVWGTQSEWIETAPGAFYEPAAVRSHYDEARLLQKPYTSMPPQDDGELNRGKTLEELVELYRKAAENPPAETDLEPKAFAL